MDDLARQAAKIRHTDAKVRFGSATHIVDISTSADWAVRPEASARCVFGWLPGRALPET